METKELRAALQPLVKALADAASELEEEVSSLKGVASAPLLPAPKEDKKAFTEQRAQEALNYVQAKLAIFQNALAQAQALLVPESTGVVVAATVVPAGGAAIAVTAELPPAVASKATLAAETKEVGGQDAGGRSWGFSEFLSSVGSCMVSAQRKLDGESQQYVVEQLKQQGMGLPAMFRIPKLSAEIKFALSTEKTTGLNLLLFSDKQKSSEQHQQSMSFDVVAMPPPPEVIRAVQSAAPRIGLVLDPAERARVFDAVSQVKDSKVLERGELLGDPNRPESENLETVRDYVVIIPADLDVEEAAPKQYFLFQADEAEEHLLGIWSLQIGAAEPNLQPVYRFSAKPKPGENIAAFKEWLTALGEAQAKILKALRLNA